MDCGKYGPSSLKGGSFGLCLREGGQPPKLYSVGNPVFAVYCYHCLLCFEPSFVGVSSLFPTTQVAFRGKPQCTARVMFLTWVNFRLTPLPRVRLGPILGCSDLTEWEAKRDLAVAARTVYPSCWCQWSVWKRELKKNITLPVLGNVALDWGSEDDGIA